MRHLFLDTNVVIDVLVQREPFYENSAKVIDLKFSHNARLYISTISYQIIYFILKKKNTHKEVISLLNGIFTISEIIDVTSHTIQESLKSEFSDFEDAIQYYSAISNDKIEIIVTRNTKDFKLSKLPALTPTEVLAHIETKYQQ